MDRTDSVGDAYEIVECIYKGNAASSFNASRPHPDSMFIFSTPTADKLPLRAWIRSRRFHRAIFHRHVRAGGSRG